MAQFPKDTVRRQGGKLIYVVWKVQSDYKEDVRNSLLGKDIKV